MKRLHMNLRVNDLAVSTNFYTKLFGAEPTVDEPDYKKWLLDDPFVNISIEPAKGKSGIAHVGLQASNDDELQDIYRNIEASGADTFEEGETQCCYAHSYKTWTRDPDGIVWEAFFTDGQREDYGAAPDIEVIGKSAHCC
ncbi:VOC family protein [Pontixanthobacter sp. CEM42]|uniref:VOC family protein n=1 Tax=Pontixanthobacter sp. CEM42 TaxID=2792077 RepID=UPI001AE031E7|nr:VOC family protein [Pontixanthobacter sp. CEM42]